MKRLVLLSVLSVITVFAFTTSSCKKKKDNGNGNDNKDIITVPIDRSDTTSLPFPLPANPNSLDFTQPPFGPLQLDTFATKVDEYITPYGFQKKDIISVKVKKLNMVIENAPGQTFNFVKDQPVSIKVFVDSFTGTSPKMVASLDNVPRGQTSLELDAVQDDIKDYFKADYMKIMVAFRSQEDEGCAAGAKFRVNYTFEIKANKP